MKHNKVEKILEQFEKLYILTKEKFDFKKGNLESKNLDLMVEEIEADEEEMHKLWINGLKKIKDGGKIMKITFFIKFINRGMYITEIRELLTPIVKDKKDIDSLHAKYSLDYINENYK